MIRQLLNKWKMEIQMWYILKVLSRLKQIRENRRGLTCWNSSLALIHLQTISQKKSLKTSTYSIYEVEVIFQINDIREFTESFQAYDSCKYGDLEIQKFQHIDNIQQRNHIGNFEVPKRTTKVNILRGTPRKNDSKKRHAKRERRYKEIASIT